MVGEAKVSGKSPARRLTGRGPAGAGNHQGLVPGEDAPALFHLVVLNPESRRAAGFRLPTAGLYALEFCYLRPASFEVAGHLVALGGRVPDLEAEVLEGSLENALLRPGPATRMRVVQPGRTVADKVFGEDLRHYSWSVR